MLGKSDYSRVPAELKALPNWVCWGWTEKPLKMPINPLTGCGAKAGQPETWGTFEQAFRHVELGTCKGVGFEFADGGGLVGVDLDHCRDKDSGEINPQAAGVIRRFSSYTEISPSGTGIHIFCKGKLPGAGHKYPEAEIYDSGRFFTVTGHSLSAVPKPIADAQSAVTDFYNSLVAAHEKPVEKPTVQQSSGLSLEDNKLLEIAANAKNGALFRDLFGGNWQGHSGSQSEADIALCNILAFYCGRDAAQMDRLFRQSGLVRPKWDEKHGKQTYGAMTIQDAIQHCGKVYGEQATAADVFGRQETAKPVTPQLVPLSGVAAQSVDWLWKPYIPLGKITLIEADPGTGKTYLCLALASVVSNGGHFYMEADGTTREPGKVIYQTAEDGIADTIVPRLQSFIPPPNLENIITIDDREKGLDFMDSRIESALQAVRPKLFVIDPLQAYLGAKVDMHRANQVRPVMAHIAQLAEKYGCAFVMIMHMNKNALGEQAMYRGLGSIDIPAVARSMMFLGRNPQNKEERVLCHIKSSLAAPGQSLTFKISPDFGGVVFTGTTDLDYSAITSPQKGRNKPAPTLTDAMDALSSLLGEDGFATVQQVETLQKASGISQRTMYSAKSELALHSVSIGKPPHRTTYWTDPDLDIAKFKFDHTPPPEQETFKNAVIKDKPTEQSFILQS